MKLPSRSSVDSKGVRLLRGSEGTPGSARPIPVLHERRRPRFWLIELYGSAVGKKAVMAVTGIVLLGFVLTHMIGNLKVFVPDAEMHLNDYGLYLRTIGEPILPHTGFLWILRVGLIFAFIFHIHAAATLTILNRKARPTGYQGGRTYSSASYAARTMRWSGVIVGLFVLFHLMDITWGWHVVHQDFVDEQPYRNLWHSFSPERWPVVVVYVVANILLGIHIYHGAWSMFQSLGLNNPRFNVWRRRFAQTFAAVIVIGNVSIPLAIVSGMLDEPVQPKDEEIGALRPTSTFPGTVTIDGARVGRR
ncbi:MAG: succinate dehydrogenase cytochrome b subunit [Tepidiformaceae bacterium]